MSGQPVTLNAALAEVGAEIDRGFLALLDAPPDARARLYDAMRYSAIGDGAFGLATGEALAHLRRLEVEGKAVREARDGVHWYRRAA